MRVFSFLLGAKDKWSCYRNGRCFTLSLPGIFEKIERAFLVLVLVLVPA